MRRPKKPDSPFRYFNSSPEVIRLVVTLYVRFPLSLRNVGDSLLKRGIEVCHETVRLWWNRFGPLFAGDIRAPSNQMHRLVTGAGKAGACRAHASLRARFATSTRHPR
jgi:hypothetical protein